MLKKQWGKVKDADKLEAKLQNYLTQQFVTEDLINFDFQQHQRLAVNFPTQARTTSEVVRAHREEVLPPDLEEIYDVDWQDIKWPAAKLAEGLDYVTFDKTEPESEE